MSDLHLKIDTGENFELPVGISTIGLKPLELATLVVLTDWVSGNEEAGGAIGLPEYQEAITSLKDKGVIKVGVEGKRVKVTIDLESLFPDDEDDDG